MYYLVDVDQVPIARLTENLEKRLEKNPGDVKLLLNLARLHAMAFATKSDVTNIVSGTLDPFFGYARDGRGLPFTRKRIAWELAKTRDKDKATAASDHLTKAITTYRKLVQIEPQNGIARIGLGWCLLQAGEKIEAREVLRALLADAWAEEEKKFNYRPPDYTFLTEETSQYLLELLDPRTDAAEIATIRSQTQSFEKLGRSVTPILIPLAGNSDLDDLLARDASVRFDVDGRGREGTWSWITPRAGWLVWLPKDGSREIASGLQLFGNVTWWLFWNDGYEALTALDDDQDGFLTGHELERLGVWQDTNGNGRVDAGEVKTLDECGIQALACSSQSSSSKDVVRWSPRGVVFKGGEVRPSWDVLLRYAPPQLTVVSVPIAGLGAKGLADGSVVQSELMKHD